MGYIENCGELGKWSWKVFGGLRGFWQIETETVPKRFLVWEVFGVFGGREFLGVLSFLNFKYILWN